MARYIDLDKMYEFNCPQVWKSGENCPEGGCAECFYNNGGAEDVEPVVHAKWRERVSIKSKMIVYDCSNCLETSYKKSKYCPNCGAKMDKENENE